MKLYTKDGMTSSLSNITLIKDGMQVINPTEEQVLADGWTEYVPEPYVPQPKLEPYDYEVTAALRKMIHPQLATLSDIESAKVKQLFPTWASKIGVPVTAGEKLYYNDDLYKVIQAHTPQEDWKPDVEMSLYGLVSEHEGTADDPIPYRRKMVLEKGKHYTQNGETYLCVTGSIVGYDVDLNDAGLSSLLQKVEQ